MPNIDPNLSMAALDKRRHQDPRQRELFNLVELAPQLVVAGKMVANGFQADDVTPVGDMRETCPNCTGLPLKLVLRRDHVIRPHLFCPQCTRCFDAIDAQGNSALAFYEMPPEL
jgi:ribosomal protein S27AE